MVSHSACSTAGAVKYWANVGQSQPGLVTRPLMNWATRTSTATRRPTARDAGSAPRSAARIS